jgi:metallo-beta-lactamase family protein
VNKRRAAQGLQYIKPLYTIADAMNVFPLFKEVPYREWTKIDEEITFQFTDTGHILGSAAMHIRILENGESRQITFSGDVGRYRDVILKSPEEFSQSDYIILESTYGNSLHDNLHHTEDDILGYIEETCIQKKGKLIIPAFSVGRTQEILYALNKLETENRLPDLNYYVDSPLSTQTTLTVKKFPELFNKHVQQLMKKDKDPFDFKGLKYITKAEDSKHLNARKEPMVIISASGMAEAGRVKHHIANAIEDPRNTILMVGYCEPHSLGARLMRGDQEVRIFRQEFQVKAQIGSIRSMSAHGDYDDLCQFLACQNPSLVRTLFLVHGEEDVQLDFRKKLSRKGFPEIQIPEMHQKFKLD